MPEDFDKCVSGGGKIRTIDVGKDKYARVCILGGKTHMGEIREKAKASEDPLMNIPEKATAAEKFSKVEIVSDGTNKGTTIKINGKEVKNLSSFDFDYYDSMYMPICIRWTVRDPEVKGGEIAVTTSYCLRGPMPQAIADNKAIASEIGPFIDTATAEEVAAWDVARKVLAAQEDAKARAEKISQFAQIR